MSNKNILLANKLKKSANRFSSLIGFDGFVDEILHVVDKRIDYNNYSKIRTIEEYSNLIKRSSGLSSNIEAVTTQRKLGGNGPLFASALKKFGFEITYIGCLGKDKIDTVFNELTHDSNIFSLADPGHTDAYEFEDGKIMVNKVETFKEITWNKIIDKIGFDNFIKIVDKCSLIGMENWTLLPHMNNIWQHFLSDIIPILKTNPNKKTVFFDLSDPEKRTKDDIINAINLINSFSKKGVNTILGLNKKEACEITEIYGNSIPNYESFPLEKLCDSLEHHIHIECIVVHPVKCACCYVNKKMYLVEGPYCEHPKLTTGAGDTFNSGFILGYMNSYSFEECLLCGVAASGYYVRNAKSPTIGELSDFLISM